MEMRIIRSDGAELNCSGEPGCGWKIPFGGLQDFNSLPISLSTSANVLTDGSTLISKRVDECERTASIVYVGPRDPASVRDECLSFFNPKHSFEVHVTHMGRTRWCEGELADVKCEILADRFPCQATFTILCPDPYMRSEDGNESSLTDAAPMFGFPYVSHFKAVTPNGERYPVGFLASRMIFDGLNTIYNSGDVETQFKIVCKFEAKIVNPVFIKDGKHVQLLREFAAGDTLEIDFQMLPPKVLVNGQNAIQACSRDSDFIGMDMQVGANIFNYRCDNEENRPYMDVKILFWKKYTGV